MLEYIAIGEIIKYHRKEMGFSQSSLSEGICSRKYIGQIESGKCFPTLFIINQLSSRLEINLYDTYALMLRHHDIDTHNKIEILNNHFNKESINELPKLIDTYSELPGFKSIEPFQYLKYAEAIYLSNVKFAYTESIGTAIKGLLKRYNTINQIFQLNNHFSNIELSLILHISVNYGRVKNYYKGKKYLNLLYDYLSNILTKRKYELNKNYHFEQNLFCSIIYNEFVFFKKDDNNILLYKKIIHAINLMNSLKNSYKLPELLLSKSFIECEMNHFDLAKKSFLQAHYIGEFQYSFEYITDIEYTILDKYYTKLKNSSLKDEDKTT